jgi:hypothetical protein
MSILDRFRRRTVQPSTSQRKVRDQPGPLTAHEAWAIVQPIVHQLDVQARLTFVTSGLDISPEGRSFTWEFSFYLPRGKARALLSLVPSEEATEVDDAPITLIQRINPSPAAGPASFLPEHFRDSPEVVSEFAVKGVDFVAGPTDMKLEGRVVASGEPVWITYYWDEEHRTGFSQPDS